MKNSLLILALLASSALAGQTKMIAHKSHGGSSADFRLALEHDEALLAGSDFGVAPMTEVRVARLDTVIFISEQEQVMITSACYYTAEAGTDRPISDTSLWQPGRETVYEHPLFSQQHRLPWIKRQLDRHYNFTNPADSVVFIGFDEDQPLPDPPVVTPPQDQQEQGQQPPGGNQEAAPKTTKGKSGKSGQENLAPDENGPEEILPQDPPLMAKAGLFSIDLQWWHYSLFLVGLGFLGRWRFNR